MALEYAVEAVAALSTPTDAVTAVIVVADRSRLVAALHSTAATGLAPNQRPELRHVSFVYVKALS